MDWMKLHSARRAVALAAALTASVAGALVGTTTATAATRTPVITLTKPAPVAVAPASAKGLAATVQPSFDYQTTARNLNANATITIDARKLANVAHVDFSSNCTVKNLVATCWEQFYAQNLTPGAGLGGVTQMTVSALKGVAPGTIGSYTVTGTADTAKIVGADGTVQVGGPAFNQTSLKNYTNLKVGTTVSEPVRFTNIGTRPAAGTEVLLMTSPGLDFTTHYSNCKYSTPSSSVVSAAAVCSIPGQVRVGETAALAAPVRVHVNSTAYYTFLDTVTAPLGDPNDNWIFTGRTWKQGTGGKLGLQVIAAGHSTSAPTGTVSLSQTGNGNYQVASLQARNTADFGVTGASARAAKGKTAKLTFRMTNHGPATIFYRSGDSLGVKVTIPPGTTVVGSSANCWPSVSSDPTVAAHGPYSCAASYLVPNGQVSTFTITVRMDKVIAHAKGSVAMDWSPQPGWRPPFDTNPRNDSAALTLN
jgi:hypothetical protein